MSAFLIKAKFASYTDSQFGSKRARTYEASGNLLLGVFRFDFERARFVLSCAREVAEHDQLHLRHGLLVGLAFQLLQSYFQRGALLLNFLSEIIAPVMSSEYGAKMISFFLEFAAVTMATGQL